MPRARKKRSGTTSHDRDVVAFDHANSKMSKKARDEARFRLERHVDRARYRVPVETDGLGADDIRVSNAVNQLWSGGITSNIVLPDRKDRGLVGRSSGYVDGDPPNPYLSYAIFSEFAEPDRCVWEVAATAWPACDAASFRAGMPVALTTLPGHRGDRVRVRRQLGGGKATMWNEPAFVLVHLPLLMDKWSRYQHRRLWASETIAVEGGLAIVPDLAIWDAGTEQEHHPEFATDFDTYVKTARMRIGCVVATVPTGTPIVITVRHRFGVVPHIYEACEQVRLQQNPKFEADVFEVGGTKHVGDDTPLMALDLSVWRSS